MEKDINLHIVLVQAFIIKEKKILMAQRALDDKQAPGMWSTPGGKVDNELGDGVIESTLKKEIMEEVGVEVEDNFEYIGSQAFTRSSGHHVVALSFVAKWKSGEAKPLEDQNAVKWVDIAELEEILNSEGGPKHFKQFLRKLRTLVD